MTRIDSVIYFTDSTVTRSYIDVLDGNGLVFRSIRSLVRIDRTDSTFVWIYNRNSDSAYTLDSTAYTPNFNRFTNITIAKQDNATGTGMSLNFSRSSSDAIAGADWSSISGFEMSLTNYGRTEIGYSIDPLTGVRTNTSITDIYLSGSRRDSTLTYFNFGTGTLTLADKKINVSSDASKDSMFTYTFNTGSATLTSVAVFSYSSTYPSSLPNVFPQITSNELETEFLPSTIELSQNYPNPFNPSTQIEFNLQQAGLVRLTVYDLLGREVKTLVNRGLSAGTHTFTFDANGLSSGVYFYRLDASGQTLTRKMTLLK